MIYTGFTIGQDIQNLVVIQLFVKAKCKKWGWAYTISWAKLNCGRPQVVDT